MKPDRPLIFSVLCLGFGLGVIFGYCNGTTSLATAYPFSGTVLHINITTVGIGVLGGVFLTALGVLLLVWAFVAAIVSQVGLMMDSDAAPERLLE